MVEGGPWGPWETLTQPAGQTPAPWGRGDGGRGPTTLQVRLTALRVSPGGRLQGTREGRSPAGAQLRGPERLARLPLTRTDSAIRKTGLGGKSSEAAFLPRGV